MKAPFNVASSIQSTIKLAKFFPSGQLMGQKELECHKGRTREPVKPYNNYYAYEVRHEG